MKIVTILMVGCFLHTIQVASDSRQDFHLEDGLSTFLTNIKISWNEQLIPTKDITQKEIIDILCSVNIVTADEF